MKNSDEAVERVLAGLREAEAPEGMERRILEAVQDVPEQRQGWSFGRRAMPWRLAGRMSWATAAAGVAVVAGMLCWSSLRSSRSGDPAVDQSVMPKGRTGVASTSIPGPERRSAKAFEETPVTPVRRSQASMRPGKMVRVRARDVTDGRKARLASYPAPPMPLTKQERLLLRLAHNADPAEIAMLDPAVRAARDAEETAEFREFFERANAGDHE